jgi:hypothetical protein
MYIKKSSGPKTEPCGTPWVFASLFEISIPIWVVCVRPVRYELNEYLIDPIIP